MRLFEIAFITLVTLTLMARFVLPLPESSAYTQEWILANDLYLELYRNFGTAMYDENTFGSIALYLDNFHKETGLCVVYKINMNRIKLCDHTPKSMAYIQRQVLDKSISLGVGN